MTCDPEKLGRRVFAERLLKALAALFALAVTGVWALFAYPSRERKKRLVFFDIGEVAALPERGVSERMIAYTQNDRSISSKIFLVNTDAELYALSSVCTHLGCLVSWHRSREKFLCPCHRGQYDIQGQVVAGPPPAPLARLPVKIESDRILAGVEV
jgi:cytochrome b6-f complex iron-sulfur subunit